MVPDSEDNNGFRQCAKPWLRRLAHYDGRNPLIFRMLCDSFLSCYSGAAQGLQSVVRLQGGCCHLLAASSKRFCAEPPETHTIILYRNRMTSAPLRSPTMGEKSPVTILNLARLAIVHCRISRLVDLVKHTPASTPITSSLGTCSSCEPPLGWTHHRNAWYVIRRCIVMPHGGCMV